MRRARSARSKKRGSAQKPARKKRATRGRKAASSEDEEEEEEEEEDSGDSGGGGGAPASGGRGGGGGGRRRAAKDESSDDDGFEIDDEALIEGEEDRKRCAGLRRGLAAGALVGPLWRGTLVAAVAPGRLRREVELGRTLTAS